MKKALGVLTSVIVAIAMVFAMVGCANNSGVQPDNSGLQAELARLTDVVNNLKDKVDDLTDENGALNKRVDDLTDENGALNKRVDDLTDENGALNKRVDDLTDENGALNKRVEGLNVFWTDKAEYAEDETMTVYFNNQAALKIRINFNTLSGTALFGGSSLNLSLYITSLCSDIYAESIVNTSFVVSDAGNFVRDPSTGASLLKKM